MKTGLNSPIKFKTSNINGELGEKSSVKSNPKSAQKPVLASQNSRVVCQSNLKNSKKFSRKSTPRSGKKKEKEERDGRVQVDIRPITSFFEKKSKILHQSSYGACKAKED